MKLPSVQRVANSWDEVLEHCLSGGDVFISGCYQSSVSLGIQPQQFYKFVRASCRVRDSVFSRKFNYELPILGFRNFSS